MKKRFLLGILLGLSAKTALGAIYQCTLRSGVYGNSESYDTRAKAQGWCDEFYRILGASDGCKVVKLTDYRWRGEMRYAFELEQSGYSYSEVRFQLNRRWFEWQESRQLHLYSAIRPYLYYPQRCG